MDEKEYLYDIDFLNKLFSQRLRETFVKIIALDLEENLKESIEGKCTAGSVNVDGSSAARRTCSITIVANELNIHEYYWGLNTKFKLFVGLRNLIDSKYDDIVWFPQGLFLITSFNTKQATNSWQISISGKDKMCLLNGEIGGNITSLSYDFGKIDRVNTNGTVTTEDYLVKDIIREGVHTFGMEPYRNIIINDLDEAALELLEYRGDSPIYLIFEESGDEASNFTFDTDTKFLFFENETWVEKTIEQLDLLSKQGKFNFYPRLETELKIVPSKVKANGNTYMISKVETEGVAGYRKTELTYAGDLIGKLGDSFTSACLDKLVSMLGEYEYFYDVYGHFIFQRKRNYVNTSWNNIKMSDDTEWVDANAYNSECTWFFENTELITSIQNTPDYKNLKNDFSVWGVKNEKYPIHMRYVIDKKPQYYKTIEGQIFYTKDCKNKNSGKLVDWREIIYQMAYDAMHYGTIGEEGNLKYLDSFLAEVLENNKEYYPTGQTGYENYYTDIYSFWREIYNPFAEKKFEVAYVPLEKYLAPSNVYYWFQPCEEIEKWMPNREYFYLNVSTLKYVKKPELTKANENEVNKELLDSLKDFYILRNTTLDDKNKELYNSNRAYYKELETDFITGVGNDYSNCWHKDVFSNPELLTFWFDFLDSDSSEIEKYEVCKIGSRPKTENNDKLKSIYFIETPTIIFYKEDTELYSYHPAGNISSFEGDKIYYYFDEEQKEYQKEESFIVDSNKKYYFRTNDKKSGYQYLKITKDIEPYFKLSTQGISIKDQIDNLLYKHTYCSEQITITCLPIYHLQPNTRIFVYDKNSGINGEYIIKSISIPMTYNGTSNIVATKAVERLY